MTSEEQKFIPELSKTREELAAFLGDAERWHRVFAAGGNCGSGIVFYQCPQCGAACLNPHQHKAWHLQNCI